MGVVGLEAVEDPLVQRVVPAGIDMDNHLDGRVDLLHGFVAAVDQLGKGFGTVGLEHAATCCPVIQKSAGVVGCRGPQHAAGGFVAYLYPIGSDSK